MKVCCISDIHENYDINIPDCDLVLIAGDIFGSPKIRSQLFWMNKFCNFINSIEERGIKWLMTPGNHDAIFEPEFIHLIPDKIKDNCLIDKSKCVLHNIDNINYGQFYNVYGSPWQRRFFDWSFNLDEEDLERKWSMIPDDTNILLLHSPPFGILDGNLGSPTLTTRIKELADIKLVVFGHIHYGYGHIVDESGTHFVNASQSNEKNILVREPIVVEI